MTRLRLAHFPPRIKEDPNPYARLLYQELAQLGFETVPDPDFTLSWLGRARRHVDILHFHWGHEQYYEPRLSPFLLRLARRPSLNRLLPWLSLSSFVGRLAVARLLGYRVVWTIHEVIPHESSTRHLDRLAARALARFSHVLLAHDQATAERARIELGAAAAEVHVVPHGSYVGVYPPGRPRHVVRSELELPPEAFVFLAFGHLRWLKQIDLLLEAFLSLPLPQARLIVAGEVWEEPIGLAVKAAASRDPRIRAILEYIPEDRVAELFGACDAAVLARGDGWTSGSLILALSQGLPVVVARRPAYAELLEGEAACWLFQPGDAVSLRSALAAAAADPAGARRKGAAALGRAQGLSWSESAALSARFLVGNTRRRAAAFPAAEHWMGAGAGSDLPAFGGSGSGTRLESRTRSTPAAGRS